MQFKLSIENTLQRLLAQEDTDFDKKITKEDDGPKCFEIKSTTGKSFEVKGTYFLSNLLQELALAKNEGLTIATIDLKYIEEPPANRISRMIREYFWDDLTRTIDEQGLSKILEDSKASDGVQRMYVPSTDAEGILYYKKLAEKTSNVEVVVLPHPVTPEFVKSINSNPGILALKLDKGEGVPFVVPGGRFNEMYGWDSYFEGVGLLLDGRADLAKAMVDNFCYQITHYGKILNANRSYYLTRTQPPFLASFVKEVYEADPSVGIEWLEQSVSVAITEYESVWMKEGKRLISETGLNRYLAAGLGIPPETEPGHFDTVLKQYAKKHQMELAEFITAYQSNTLIDKELDLYFLHDRSLRESGHDTSWRLDNCCADLNTVDLNSLLYVYEQEFAHLIQTYFGGVFKTKDNTYTSEYWLRMGAQRKQKMNTLMWNESAKSFFDYNVRLKTQTGFASATNFYPLWAKLCTPEQAEAMVAVLVRDFKAEGGIVATSAAAVAPFAHGEQRQWDYPNGWAPHQMLIWKGLKQYGFEKELTEIVYRWLFMITKNAVDYNGTIPEKYDVVGATHKVYAEYGNVGTEFDYITTSGFGWMNASYQYGLRLLPKDMVANLNKMVQPKTLF